MEVVNIRTEESKSRPEIIAGLRRLLELAHTQKLEYMELIYKVDGMEYNKHYIDSVYKADSK